MQKYKLILVFILISFSVRSINLKIRLFSTKKDNKAIVSITQGNCYILALNKRNYMVDTIAFLTSNNRTLKTLYFNKRGVKISISQINKNLGLFHKVYIKAENNNSTYTIRYKSKNRTYQGDLILFSKKGKFIEIINYIDIERYVAGVVESEGGHCFYPEYLKAQAVLARSYAIKNRNKFPSEEYHLTDDVRSQVYHSRAYLVHSKEIIKATKETKGLVVYDTKGNIIDAVFHANSGGETVDPKYVWVSDGVSYLVPRIDPYSVGTGSYSWKKIISKNRYMSFFKKKFTSLYKDKKFEKIITNLKQRRKRKNIIRYKNYIIKLAHLRNYLKIKSTFFDATDLGNGKILLKGKGFGHGIGLAQDGAIKMAKNGIGFRNIINFYYHNVLLDNYNKTIKTF